MSRTNKKGKSKNFPKEKDECLRETNRILRQKVKQLQETVTRLNQENIQLKQLVECKVDKPIKNTYNEPIKDIKPKKKDEPETVDEVRERFRSIYSGSKDKRKDN